MCRCRRASQGAPHTDRGRTAVRPRTNGKGGSNSALSFYFTRPEQTSAGELVHDVAITRPGGHWNETYRFDWSCTDCFAGHERIRIRQAGHGSDRRRGRLRDPGQAWARPWPRAHAPGPRSSLRLAQGPRSPQAPPLPIVFRWIRVRHPIARANADGSGSNGSRLRRGRFSGHRASERKRAQPSSISTAIRIRSE